MEQVVFHNRHGATTVYNEGGGYAFIAGGQQ